MNITSLFARQDPKAQLNCITTHNITSVIGCYWILAGTAVSGDVSSASFEYGANWSEFRHAEFCSFFLSKLFFRTEFCGPCKTVGPSDKLFIIYRQQ